MNLLKNIKYLQIFTSIILLWHGAAMATPPTVTILSPSDQDSYAFGEYIIFIGTGSDPDDPTSEVTLTWNSSLNGTLTLVNNAFNGLDRGLHTITLSAVDVDLEPASTSITLYIRGEPRASILSPASGSELRKGEPVTFSGVGKDDKTDYDDDKMIPPIPLSYQWILDGTTVLSESDTFTALGTTDITLDYGLHTIDFTVTDRDGDTDTASINVEVLNTNPTAVISAPLTGSSYHYEDDIILDGSASYDGLDGIQDEDDGLFLPADFSWSSNLDGNLGQGEQIIVTDLSLGTHLIQLTVTDSQGGTGTETVNVTITQQPPVAVINSPLDGSAFTDAAEIEFMGDGTDPDDTEDSLTFEWRSSLDGIISTERVFAATDLTDGVHTITLTVTDPHGATATASIDISTTNTLPSATILTPSDGARFDYGETITFTGEGMTYQDVEITGTDLVWSDIFNDATTDIGTGKSISVDTLISGPHIIQLTATDSSNAKTMTDTINLTIGLRAQDAAGTDITSLQIQDGLETIMVSGGVPPYSAFATSPVSTRITGITDDIATITVSGTRTGTGRVIISDDEGTDVTISVVIGGATTGVPPVADAGDNQMVQEGSTVFLDGTGSYDTDDAIVSYRWEESFPLIFSNETSPQPYFVAPSVTEGIKVLTLSLTVTDENNNQDTDDVVVTVADNGITRYPAEATAFLSATGKEMGIYVESGGNLTQLSVVSPDAVGMPGNMIYGLIDFTVRLYNQVDTILVAVYLPEPAPSGSIWYKYSPTSGWVNFSREVISGGTGDGAVFSNDRTIVYLYFTDNGAYDDNGAVLTISDPSGLYIPSPSSEEDDPWYGCFLNSL